MTVNHPTPRPNPCDCTARCGDDPRLERGACTPCERYEAFMRHVARQAKARQLLAELGFADCLAALQRLQELMSKEKTS